MLNSCAKERQPCTVQHDQLYSPSHSAQQTLSFYKRQTYRCIVNLFLLLFKQFLIVERKSFTSKVLSYFLLYMTIMITADCLFLSSLSMTDDIVAQGIPTSLVRNVAVQFLIASDRNSCTINHSDKKCFSNYKLPRFFGSVRCLLLREFIKFSQLHVNLLLH